MKEKIRLEEILVQFLHRPNPTAISHSIKFSSHVEFYMRSWYKNFNLTVNWSDREWNSSITMVKLCLLQQRFNQSFSNFNTYAVVVAPNTKRATAADLKCTILLYGINGLGEEECLECSSRNYEEDRGSTNHGKNPGFWFAEALYWLVAEMI